MLAAHVRVGDLIADLLQAGEVPDPGVEGLVEIGELGSQSVGDLAKRIELRRGESTGLLRATVNRNLQMRESSCAHA